MLQQTSSHLSLERYTDGLSHHLNGCTGASQSFVSLTRPALISAERLRRQREGFTIRPVMTLRQRSAEGKCTQTALSSNGKSTNSVFLCGGFNRNSYRSKCRVAVLTYKCRTQRTRRPNSGPLKVPVESFQRLIKLDNVNDY